MFTSVVLVLGLFVYPRLLLWFIYGAHWAMLLPLFFMVEPWFPKPPLAGIALAGKGGCFCLLNRFVAATLILGLEKNPAVVPGHDVCYM